MQSQLRNNYIEVKQQNNKYIPKIIPQQQFIPQNLQFPQQNYVSQPQFSQQSYPLQTQQFQQNSVVQTPVGCCGGNLFSPQGSLCAPLNYNPCQQKQASSCIIFY